MTQAHAIVQYNQDQLAIIRNTVAKGTSPDQFKLFMEVCYYHNLSPFARQIYAVVRGGQMTIQTSIDGYRLLAERSGKYAGQVGPQWCGEDGVWVDVWLSDKPPAAARIGVLRKDFQQPTWGVAKYKSYFQESSPLWRKMPDVMLAKCAESLALRKAFPAEMSGIYTAEEMQQADNELPTVALHPTTVDVDAPPNHNAPVSRQNDRTEANVEQTPNKTPASENAGTSNRPDATKSEKPRIVVLRDLAVAKGELLEKAQIAAVLVFCSRVLKANLTAQAQLTPSRMDKVEEYLNALPDKDAQPEEVQASA